MSQNTAKNKPETKKTDSFTNKPGKTPLKDSQSVRKPSQDIPKDPPLQQPKPLENPPKDQENQQIRLENSRKVLVFLQKAPENMEEKNKACWAGLINQINQKNKPSMRVFGFFSSVPGQIQAKNSLNLNNFAARFNETKFEADHLEFKAELQQEHAKTLQKESKKPLKTQKKEKEAKNGQKQGKKIEKTDSLGLEEAEILRKEQENNETKRKILEAEKKKMLLEQKLREVDRQIHSLETSVSQRILEESESQSLEVIRLLEEKKQQEAGVLAAELAKKMARLKLEREEREARKKEGKDRELKKRLEEDKKAREEKEEVLREEKKRKILEKLEEMKQRKAERLKVLEASSSMIQQSKSHYQQSVFSMEKSFQKNIDIPQLERRKKDLESRRNLYKPIDGEEIKKHEKRYEEMRKVREEEGRLKTLKELESRRLGTKKYESRVLGKVLKGDEETRRREESLKEKRRLLLEKQQKYQSIIKDLFKPKSVKKEQEGLKKEYEIEPIGETFENSGDQGVLLSGQQVLPDVKKKQQRRLQINYQLPWRTIKPLEIKNKTVEQLNKDFIRTEIESNKNSKRYEDYLKQVRSQREELEARGVVKRNPGWDRFIRDDSLDSREKFASVINTANNIENKAKMKEEMAMKGGKGDLNVQDEINELYLESIKAKLALLNMAPKSK